MREILITLSILLASLCSTSAHSLAKTQLQDTYSIHEDQDTLSFHYPHAEQPILRDIIYYHVREHPYPASSAVEEDSTEVDNERETTNYHELQFLEPQPDHEDDEEKHKEEASSQDAEKQIDIEDEREPINGHGFQFLETENGDNYEEQKEEAAVQDMLLELASMYQDTTPMTPQNPEVMDDLETAENKADEALQFLNNFQAVSARNLLFDKVKEKYNTKKQLPENEPTVVRTKRSMEEIPEAPRLNKLNFDSLPPYLRRFYPTEHRLSEDHYNLPPLPNIRIEREGDIKLRMKEKISEMIESLKGRLRQRRVRRDVPTYGMNLTNGEGYVWNDLNGSPGMYYELGNPERNEGSEVVSEPAPEIDFSSSSQEPEIQNTPDVLLNSYPDNQDFGNIGPIPTPSNGGYLPEATEAPFEEYPAVVNPEYVDQIPEVEVQTELPIENPEPQAPEYNGELPAGESPVTEFIPEPASSENPIQEFPSEPIIPEYYPTEAPNEEVPIYNTTEAPIIEDNSGYNPTEQPIVEEIPESNQPEQPITEGASEYDPTEQPIIEEVPESNQPELPVPEHSPTLQPITEELPEYNPTEQPNIEENPEPRQPERPISESPINEEPIGLENPELQPELPSSESPELSSEPSPVNEDLGVQTAGSENEELQTDVPEISGVQDVTESVLEDVTAPAVEPEIPSGGLELTTQLADIVNGDLSPVEPVLPEEEKPIYEEPSENGEESSDVIGDNTTEGNVNVENNEENSWEPKTVADLLKDDEFWSWLSDWVATYMDMMLDHVSSSVKDEVAKQMESYVKFHKLINEQPEIEAEEHSEYPSIPFEDRIVSTEEPIVSTEPPKPDEGINLLLNNDKIIVDGKEIPFTHSSNLNLNDDSEDVNDVDLRRRKDENERPAVRPEGNVQAHNLFGNSVGNKQVTNIFIFYNNDTNSNGIFSFGPNSTINSDSKTIQDKDEAVDEKEPIEYPIGVETEEPSDLNNPEPTPEMPEENVDSENPEAIPEFPEENVDSGNPEAIPEFPEENVDSGNPEAIPEIPEENVDVPESTKGPQLPVKETADGVEVDIRMDVEPTELPEDLEKPEDNPAFQGPGAEEKSPEEINEE